jgi:hypothetical protein
MGEVDAEVVDGDDVRLTVYCLTDAPTGTMTLPGAPGPSPAPSATTYVDYGQPHEHDVKSKTIGPVTGLTDVAVRDPSCAKGMGEVDVEVVDHDDLHVIIYCDRDASTRTTTPMASASPQARPLNGGH